MELEDVLLIVRIANGVGNDTFSHTVVDGVTVRQGIEVVAIRDPWGMEYFSPLGTFKKYWSGEVVVPWKVRT